MCYAAAYTYYMKMKSTRHIDIKINNNMCIMVYKI